MKKIKIKSKLTLNKMVISKLNSPEIIIGGGPDTIGFCHHESDGCSIPQCCISLTCPTGLTCPVIDPGTTTITD